MAKEIKTKKLDDLIFQRGNILADSNEIRLLQIDEQIAQERADIKAQAESEGAKAAKKLQDQAWTVFTDSLAVIFQALKTAGSLRIIGQQINKQPGQTGAGITWTNWADKLERALMPVMTDIEFKASLPSRGPKFTDALKEAQKRAGN